MKVDKEFLKKHSFWIGLSCFAALWLVAILTVKVAGSDEKKKSAVLTDTEVALCAGRAGVRILSSAQLAAAKQLLIAADVNAVPPPGIEGLDMQANGSETTPHGALGLGPLAIGNIKYKTEFGLFQKMISATKLTDFDFRGAFALARELNG